MTQPSTPLMTAAWPASGRLALMRAILLVVGGTLLLTICAKIQVPMWPVQQSMQTFAVMIIGLAYGWRLAGATLMSYLAAGFAGLPVFGGAIAGPAYFLGPTAGYLIGFFMAAVAIGWLVERGWDRSLFTTVAALLIGNAVLYIPGLLWLGIMFMPGVMETLVAGLFPFLTGMVLKIALATAAMPLAWKLVGRPH
ncbi:MAG: biotin transporter BioY [Alphaproteobacteria bacterium]|jgi:biotin transport system substrate-specific component|nr:biotin transporter BioY [Alphaproteobacteria bacterium]